MHLDADGNETGRTIVTRDTVWTAEYRALLIAEAHELCPQCGGLRSVCSDPTRDFHEQRDYCYVTAATNRFERGLRDFYRENDPPTGKEWREDEGVHIWASDRALSAGPDQRDGKPRDPNDRGDDST